MEGIIGAIIGAVLGAGVTETINILYSRHKNKNDEYESLKKKVSFALSMYAKDYMNPIQAQNTTENGWKAFEKAQDGLRTVACELRAYAENLKECEHDQKKKMMDVSSELIGLSNSIVGYSEGQVYRMLEYNEKRVYRIRELMDIVEE